MDQGNVKVGMEQKPTKRYWNQKPFHQDFSPEGSSYSSDKCPHLGKN